MNSRVKNKINDLRVKLRKLNHLYYDGNPAVDDEVYDTILQELINLEKLYPQYDDSNSPSKKVGFSEQKNFEKTNHKIPMLSLDNAFDLNSLNRFYDNCLKCQIDLLGFVFEPKIDGSSISLIYKNNKLVDAISRGDGIIGERIFQNIKTIKSIPKYIQNGFNNFEIRGEIYMSKINYEKYKKIYLEQQLIKHNQKKQKNISNTINIKLLGNSRNVVAGSLRLLNASLVAQRPLDAIFYQIFSYDSKHKIKTQTQVHELLKKWGFQILPNNFSKHVNNFDQICKFIEYFDKNKDNLEFPCDGLVLKVNNHEAYDLIGKTAKFPKWAIAYKFPTTIKKTRLLDIKATTGRTGKITYVAQLEPIEINNTIVQFATLHNANYIQDRDIRINDIVSVYKSGEIIPKIIAPDLNLRQLENRVWSPSKNCSQCNSLLVSENNHVDQFCLNPNCLAQVLAKIIHWCSREAMNIVGLSNAIIKKLYKLNILKNIVDIYYLNKFKDQVLAADVNIKDLLFNKLINAINESKKNSLEKTLFGLGILHVGATTAKILAAKFLNIDQLINATYDQLIAVDTIGATTAQAIVNWFSKKENKNLINELKDLNLNFNYLNSFNLSIIDFQHFLYQKRIVITGKLFIDRKQLIELLIKKFDCKIKNKIDANTDYLILGKNVNQNKKTINAKKYNTKTILHNEIERLLK